MQIKMSMKHMTLSRTSTDPTEHTLILEATGNQYEIGMLKQKLQVLMSEMSIDSLAPKSAR
jgi:hypothetical protein